MLPLGPAAVDELHITFTQSKPMPWFVPHVPPTHKKVAVDMVVVVQFRGDTPPVSASIGIMPRCSGTWACCRRRTLRLIARRDHMQTPGAVGHDPGTPQKGPRVWLDMDQAELDAAYTQSVWAPTARSSSPATGAPARSHVRTWVRHNAMPTVRPLSRHSTSTAPHAPARRSISSSMVGRGAVAWPRTTPLPPSCSSTPGPIA